MCAYATYASHSISYYSLDSISKNYGRTHWSHVSWHGSSLISRSRSHYFSEKWGKEAKLASINKRNDFMKEQLSAASTGGLWIRGSRRGASQSITSSQISSRTDTEQVRDWSVTLVSLRDIMSLRRRINCDRRRQISSYLSCCSRSTDCSDI